jgi:hypothetical protein
MNNDPLSGKRHGSRRWREASRDRSLIARRDENGIIPRDDEVGIDFVCRNGHGLLGQFRMSTMDDSDRTAITIKLPDGSLPTDADAPEGKGKALLMCDRCPTDRQYTAARIEEALNAIWAPHSRRVVTREV